MTSIERIVVFRGRRSVGKRARQAWSDERRTTYLIVEDVFMPLSLDAGVLPKAIPDEPASDVIDLCGEVVVTQRCPEVAGVWAHARALQLPAIAEEEATVLGFDICDSVGTSGLMNCGIGELEKAKIDGYWRLALNRHHLFERLDDADRYRERLNSRVPEHTPFAVIRLLAARP